MDCRSCFRHKYDIVLSLTALKFLKMIEIKQDEDNILYIEL